MQIVEINSFSWSFSNCSRPCILKNQDVENTSDVSLVKLSLLLLCLPNMHVLYQHLLRDKRQSFNYYYKDTVKLLFIYFH